MNRQRMLRDLQSSAVKLESLEEATRARNSIISSLTSDQLAFVENRRDIAGISMGGGKSYAIMAAMMLRIFHLWKNQDPGDSIYENPEGVLVFLSQQCAFDSLVHFLQKHRLSFTVKTGAGHGRVVINGIKWDSGAPITIHCKGINSFHRGSPFAGAIRMSKVFAFDHHGTGIISDRIIAATVARQSRLGVVYAWHGQAPAGLPGIAAPWPRPGLAGLLAKTQTKPQEGRWPSS